MQKTSMAMLAGAAAMAASITTACSAPRVKTSPSTDAARVERGHYLVTVGGCNDCHTPWKMGPKGPEPDMSRVLSGHPEQFVVTMPATLTSPDWMIASTPTTPHREA